MHVKSISLKNFKNIEEFSSSFSGNIYFLRGDNERGKTTLIDALLVALRGTKNAGELLQKGKEKGQVPGRL